MNHFHILLKKLKTDYILLNIDSEKGFMFFQNFMKNNGILEELEELGIEDGDTVKIYGHQFDYYK